MISVIRCLRNWEQICLKSVPTCMIMFIPYWVSSTWSPSCFLLFLLITWHQHSLLTCHIYRWYHRIPTLYGLYCSLHRLLCLAVGSVSFAFIPICRELMWSVILVALIAHHTSLLMSCSDTLLINMGFYADEYLLSCEFTCPLLWNQAPPLDRMHVASVYLSCDWWKIVCMCGV